MNIVGIWSIINTSVLFLYVLLLETPLTGVFALLLIVVWGANILAQIIMAVLTRPKKITFNYFTIIFVRFVLFLVMPLPQITSSKRLILLAIITAINIFQFKTATPIIYEDSQSLDINEENVAKAKNNLLSLACASFCIASMMAGEMISSIILLFVLVYILAKQNVLKTMYYWIEIVIALVSSIIHHLGIVGDKHFNILVVIVFLVYTTINSVFLIKK